MPTTKEDIILREDLEELWVQHPNQFKLWFTLDQPPEGAFPISGHPTVRALLLCGFWFL